MEMLMVSAPWLLSWLVRAFRVRAWTAGLTAGWLLRTSWRPKAFVSRAVELLRGRHASGGAGGGRPAKTMCS
eukprot:12905606-Prorocentrum_lima.AAC.1